MAAGLVTVIPRDIFFLVAQNSRYTYAYAKLKRISDETS